MPIRIALASSLVSLALVVCGEAAQLGRTSSRPPDPAAVRTANEASAIPSARSLEAGDGRLTPEGRLDDAGVGGRQSVERIRNLLEAGGMPDVGAGHVDPADAAEGQTGVTVSASQSSIAAVSTSSEHSGAWYVQWGYNTERYARTDIHFDQPARGNAFTLHGVEMRDAKNWDIWNHALTVPQYSLRIGRFIRSNTAIELNFDHSKAIMVVDQSVLVTGALNGRTVNETVRAGDLASRYFLNNGANFVLVNAVQRLPMVGTPGHARSVAALVKAGLGFMVPHAENTVLGESNQAGFQYGGLGAGLEAGLRVHLLRHLFVEAAQKVFYGRYRKLNIAAGSASQDLWAHVTILSVGTTW
jgi:hypothetical protein